MITPENTRIIFVHGLASKPSKDDLLDLWSRAFLANIQLDCPELAKKLEKNTDLFRFAYWANAIPDHIEDDSAYVRKLRDQVDAVIAVRKSKGNDLHISSSGWIESKIKKFGLGVVDALSRALTIKDNVMEENFREVRWYKNDQYVADRIRTPLEEVLREAWDNNRNIMVLSHSMGTFLTYDVLWRFSHRGEYKSYRKKRVQLFITMGSPLGDPSLRDFMLIERWKDAADSSLKRERQRFYPGNVDRWYNFSAHGDVVCHDSDLEDDYFAGMRKSFNGYKREHLKDYKQLYNPYRNVDGKSNPHKSYGYLIQPKLAQKVREFFGYENK